MAGEFESPDPTMEAVQDKGNRVALVTGATGAIGKAIAQGIAQKDGYRVVLLARN